MLNILLNNAKSGKGKTLSDYNRFLDKLNYLSGYYRKKFSTYEINQSGAQRLLYNLLFNIETNYLLTLKDDVERYFKSIKFMTDLTQIYDVVKHKGPFTNIFYAEEQIETKEILVSTKVKSVTNMPFDYDLDTWVSSGINPVEILADPAERPPEDLLGDVIEHPLQPNHAIVSINLPLLVMKWLSYIKSYGESAINNPNDFIHRYLMGPIWDQLVDLWLLNIIQSLVQGESVDTIMKEHEDPWGIGNVFEQGITDLDRNLISLLPDRKIDINDVLNTKLFLNGTMLQKIHYVRNYHYISNRRQYSYVKFLSHIPYIYPLINMYDMRKETSESDRVVKELLKRIRKYERTKPQTVAHDEDIKDEVELTMNTISSILLFM